MKNTLGRSLLLVTVPLAVAITIFFPISIHYVYGTHTISASPTGGNYDSGQNVTLSSSEPSATIFYTLDGSSPTNTSSIFSDPILISTNTTLKFMAIDPSDNHTSIVITESYTIDTSPPSIQSTEPEDDSTRVDPRSIVNVTFSEQMDAATINETTFLVVNEDIPIFGTVSYDELTNTASFESSFNPDCFDCISLGRVYTVTLDENIKDVAGNPLENDFVFAFRTGGAIQILVGDQFTGDVIGGSAFEITPDPFTQINSIIVEDDGTNDSDMLFYGEVIPGVIVILNTEFGTYVLSETTVPDGYEEIYENIIFTVHETNRAGSVSIGNKLSSSSIDDLGLIFPPSPHLTAGQFNLYQNEATVGIFSGIQGSDLGDPAPIDAVGPDELEAPIIATSQTIDDLSSPVRSVVFNITAPDTSAGGNLFDSFEIPTYPNPVSELANGTIYVVPAFVIPIEDEQNNFVLTPILGTVFPEMTLVLEQASFVETVVAKLERLNMTFAVEGHNIGFSFAITHDRPTGTPDPELDAPALFLDVDFVGDADFSDPASFQTSPMIDILVNKTLPGFEELPDGCSDFVMLLFDEDENEWNEIEKLRTPALDSGDETPEDPSDDKCGFTLEPPHFSKFAVGGVRGQAINTESESNERHGGGGAGSRSSSIQKVNPGTEVESKTKFGSDSVFVRFEEVQEGSGQLKMSTIEIDRMAELFAELSSLNGDKIGIVKTEGSTFSTAGKVYDIDAAAIKYQGIATVTIPYDEKLALLLGSELNIRILHYDHADNIWHDITTAMDAENNTVTGMTSSLSPIVAAVVDDETFPPVYFEINPLNKVATQNRLKFDTSMQRGFESSIPLTLKNIQRIDQHYTVIFQILDENGIARYIGWQSGWLKKGESMNVANSWTPSEAGNYTMQIFVWDDIEKAQAISKVSTVNLPLVT